MNLFDLNQAFYVKEQGERKREKTILENKIDNYYDNNDRLMIAGGVAQQDRMIRDKRRTLDRIVKYSYQGAKIRRYKHTTVYEALINPNKLKQDYDDKILSIGFEAGFHPGDIFEWCNTGTYWLVYLQDLTELAYFRGDIKKCKHQIKWVDENQEEHITYAAVRGPVETKIDYIQKHGISVDNPNCSLNILMPLNDDTKAHFKRYSRFYLQGDPDICWRVEAIDYQSMPGILEINATEYFRNETEDDIDGCVADALIPVLVDPNPEHLEIKGETFIRPKVTYTYTVDKLLTGSWEYDTKLPIQSKTYELEDGSSAIDIKWLVSYNGQFDLSYTDDLKKTIIVESLF